MGDVDGSNEVLLPPSTSAVALLSGGLTSGASIGASTVMFESLTFANAMATDSNSRAAGERRFITWCRLVAYERQLAWLEMVEEQA